MKRLITIIQNLWTAISLTSGTMVRNSAVIRRKKREMRSRRAFKMSRIVEVVSPLNTWFD